MKAEDPPRMKKKMIQSETAAMVEAAFKAGSQGTEEKCIIHCNDTFSALTTKDEVIGELLATPTLNGKEHTYYIKKFNSALSQKDQKLIIEQAAEAAARNDT